MTLKIMKIMKMFKMFKMLKFKYSPQINHKEGLERKKKRKVHMYIGNVVLYCHSSVLSSPRWSRSDFPTFWKFVRFENDRTRPKSTPSTHPLCFTLNEFFLR